MERQIAYFQIPAFEIALARLADSHLRQWPVAVAPHTPRARLHEISSEAQREGLSTGMPVELAIRLCPALRLIPPDPTCVRLAHHALQAAIARYAPIWEPVQPGHLFLDLTGTARLFGPAIDTAARIEREITERQGFTGVIGLAGNKLVSRVAATLEPPELRTITPGAERSFLAPLPVTILPGLSRTTARKTLAVLDDLNLHTLGTIAETPLLHLTLALGPPAKLLHDWAHGIDLSPVLPPVQKPCLEEAISLEPDEIDEGRLLGLLSEALERCCWQLRRQHRVCRRLTLTVRYGDHLQVSKHHLVQPATYWEVDMSPCLKTLFSRCVQRRVRLHTMTISMEVADISGAPGEQLSLFEPPSPESTPRHRLTLALDRVRDRFGERAIRYGR